MNEQRIPLNSLTEQQRTLLSGYYDSELSPTEKIHAQELLQNSADARSYLNSLEHVTAISNEAFALAPESATALYASKLSGANVITVAQQTAAAKAATVGVVWAIGGLATIVATIIGGMALFNEPTEQTVAPHEATLHQSGPTTTPVHVPFSDLDTTDLVIPPMTPNDMARFAVEGVLPLNTDRNQFLCVADSDERALSQYDRSALLADIDKQLVYATRTQQQTVDSLQGVLRTSVVRYTPQTLAVSAELPQLRASVFGILDVQELPQHSRQGFTWVQGQVSATQSVPPTNNQQYILVRQNAQNNAGNRSIISFPQQTGNNPESVFISSQALAALQQQLQSAGIVWSSPEPAPSLPTHQHVYATGAVGSGDNNRLLTVRQNKNVTSENAWVDQDLAFVSEMNDAMKRQTAATVVFDKLGAAYNELLNAEQILNMNNKIFSFTTVNGEELQRLQTDSADIMSMFPTEDSPLNVFIQRSVRGSLQNGKQSAITDAAIDSILTVYSKQVEAVYTETNRTIDSLANIAAKELNREHNNALIQKSLSVQAAARAKIDTLRMELARVVKRILLNVSSTNSVLPDSPNQQLPVSPSLQLTIPTAIDSTSIKKNIRSPK